jgi:hypothetical protein
MGCDIHAYVEVKIDGSWHMFEPVRGEGGGRDYEFFTHLCGVRAQYTNDENLWPEPKGLPLDASVISKFHSDRWGCDGHSHSWETYTEFIEKKTVLERLRGKETYEYNILGTELAEDDDPNDYRVVFWFDN